MLLRRINCQHYSTCLDQAVANGGYFSCENCTNYRQKDFTENEQLMENIRSCVLFLDLWPELATIADPATHEGLMKFLRFGEYERE